MASAQAMTTSQDLEQANKIAPTDPTKAEELYRGILSHQTSKLIQPKPFRSSCVELFLRIADEDALRDQETALIKLGALYRDHK